MWLAAFLSNTQALPLTLTPITLQPRSGNPNAPSLAAEIRPIQQASPTRTPNRRYQAIATPTNTSEAAWLAAFLSIVQSLPLTLTPITLQPRSGNPNARSLAAEIRPIQPASLTRTSDAYQQANSCNPTTLRSAAETLPASPTRTPNRRYQAVPTPTNTSEAA